nr:hypothetical transcript [Hymenolepis microstoma]
MDLGIASPELVCGAHESHSWVHQVYQYETAQALKQAPSHQASGEAIPNLNKPMSPTKGNSIRMACQTYQFGPKGIRICNVMSLKILPFSTPKEIGNGTTPTATVGSRNTRGSDSGKKARET